MKCPARLLTTWALSVWLAGAALANDTATKQDAFDAGKSLGNATKGALESRIRDAGADGAKAQLQATIPGYTDTPPQTQYANTQSLSGPATAQQQLCAANPTDTACAAANLARAQRTYPVVSHSDPALAGASVVNDPTQVLGSVSGFYAACTTTTGLISAAQYEKRTCTATTADWDVSSCDKTLEVVTVGGSTCTPNAWMNQTQGLLIAPGKWIAIYADVGCQPDRNDGKLAFRYGACIDCPSANPSATADVAVSPANSSPVLLGSMGLKYGYQIQIYAYGAGCDGKNCSVGVYFFNTGGFEPNGSGYSAAPGSAHTNIALSFPQPRNRPPPGDYWTSNCQPYEQRTPASLLPQDGVNLPVGNPIFPVLREDQCQRISSVCLDGPTTKVIDGVPATRPCWHWRNEFHCTGVLAGSACLSAAFAGCSATGRADCMRSDGGSPNHCLQASLEYECKTADAVYGQVAACPTQTFCPNGECWDTAYPPDTDFARSVTMLEAGREAGRYLDPNSLQVFKGLDNRCERWPSNCCKTGNSGAGAFTNLFAASKGLSAIATVGKAGFSTYTYDALFTSEAPGWVLSGFQSLFGTGLDSGLAGVVAGDLSVGNFMTSLIPGPWTTAMLAIQLVQLALACSDSDQVVAMKQEAGLCHTVQDSWCSRKVLGICIKKTRTSCCFPSRLAKIINEQGRPQIGKGWGTGPSPDCSGFTVDQLQQLDFAAMDLTEFYAEILPTLPNADSLRGSNTGTGKVQSCYLGEGKC